MTDPNQNETKSQSVVAKSDDGTIQVTFTIPHTVIKKSKDETIKELSKDVEVAGFRKGMAPPDKVEDKLSKNVLLEKTLNKILPNLFANAINEHKLRPAIYPKFELIKADENEDWQIRATTCELPEIDLGDYKNEILGITRKDAIWTPGKDKKEEKKELNRVEKEQKVIDYLTTKINVTIPNVLLNEEVDARLSQLLERIEKLGLTLEGYLASIGKTPQSIRQEYQEQAQKTISLELILNKIAEKENVKVSDADIDQALKAAATDNKIAEKLENPEQKRLIESILRKRNTLDLLTSLI